MSTIPIEAIAQGLVALGVAEDGRWYVGEWPAEAEAPGLMLTPLAGTAHATLPLERLPVQITACDLDHHQAWLQARACYAALHQRTAWALEGWTALGIFAQHPPRAIPAMPGSAGPVHRVRFVVEFLLRAA